MFVFMNTTLGTGPNLNDARSVATRARLVEATIECLIEIGYSKTTGVEICRRAQLTRGALNHHFPVFSDLLVETLNTLYAQLLEAQESSDGGVLEQIVLRAYARVTQPEFKAVIELWLASRNDADVGRKLAQAIAHSSELFSPAMVLAATTKDSGAHDPNFEAVYRTAIEAIIGIGLGRAVGPEEPMAHETMVLDVLRAMARQYDERNN